MRNQATNNVDRRSGAVIALIAAGLVAVICVLIQPAGSTTARLSSQPSLRQGNSEQAAVRTTAPRSGSAASTIAGTAVAAAPTWDGRGFWVAWSNGAVSAEGDAHWYGDAAGARLNRAIVGIAATPDSRGYWLLGADGGVFSFGDAGFHGSTGGRTLNAPALQMAATSRGLGYDFVAGDGGIFTFGNAHFYGSTGAMRLSKPVVGMTTTPDGRGYWLVASDGGIFTFGDARYHGSTGAMRLAQPVVGMARTLNGAGYWLLARDGGIFTFGNAGFHGSGASQTGGSPAVGLVATGNGGGYWIVLANGRILAKGNATPVSGPTAVAAPPPANGNYTFEVTSGAGVPIRWNPCDGVHYAVVAAGAPYGWQNDVNTAIAKVQAATGLAFINAGTYSSAGAVPASAKLVISWTSVLTSGDMVGLATYWYYNTPGYTPEIVSAKVQLLSSLPAGLGVGELPVLLHELGHAVGLGHTPNVAEVMNPVDQGLSGYQLGDRNGLWRLGATQGCAGFYQ
jgi:hypothetical protein